MRAVAAFVPLALAAALVGLSGCESTQATSAKREAEGKKLIKSEKGVDVKRSNPDIDVVDTHLLTDDSGTAVVVELENTSDQSFANVPISIDVRDAKGKTVFKNNTPGLEPALTHVPLLEAGKKFDWINNQVLPTGKPDSVKVTVGTSDEPVAEDVPEIDVKPPKLVSDQFTGVEAVGDALNQSDILQEDITFYAVARREGKVVAAGRAVLKRLQPDGEKAGTYHVFFVGDPKDADIEVTAPPTVLR